MSRIIENFSRFLVVEERNGYLEITGCIFDPKLRSNITRLVELQPDINEDFWALYWLKEVLKDSPNPLAKWHLSAYLEKTCYWTSVAIHHQLAAQDVNPMECFLIGRKFTSDPAKLFGKKYNSSLGGIKTYAQIKLRSLILEELRQRREIIKPRTDWALLRSLTSKSLEQALQDYGFKEIASYQLAWRCFQEIYTPTTPEKPQKLPPPNAAQWNAIANRYNQLRLRFKLEPAISPQDLQKLLKIILQAVRQQYNNSPVLARSLDEIDPSSPVPQSLISNNFSDEVNRESEWFQVSSILSQLFPSLPEDIRKMLVLWLGFQFNQTEVAGLFGWKQDKFSKQMKRIRLFLVEELLKGLEEQIRESSVSELKSPQFNKIAKQIDVWIAPYCQAPYCDFLKTTLLQNIKETVHLLQLYYGQNLAIEAVASQLNIPESEVSAKLREVKPYLQLQLKPFVEDSLRISFSSLENADEKLMAFVDNFLVNAHYANF